MSKMISVAEGFQYSVNIEYDLGNEDKLKNFIPTNVAMNLIEEILLSTNSNSTSRARILIGAYGCGKSHIILIILSLLMKKDLGLFEKLLPKIESNPKLNRLVKNFYASSNKFLPVIINGTSTDLNQSFISALYRSLAKFDLLDIFPETNFRAAVEVLNRWAKDFPKTYDEFKKFLDEPIKKFIDRLKNFDSDAYEKFEQIYPKLTAGSIFNPFLGFESVELYESVAKSLKSKGYSGIYVVYDEFSKFLESNIGRTSVSDTKMLQDFAEKANRSEQFQIHLILISHKEISNYINQLPKEKVDGWRGISNRFLHLRMNGDFAQTYEIVSEVIRRDSKLWQKFQSDHSEEFRALHEIYSNSRIFRELPDISTVVENCFPLHPVSTFILPRLSEKIAQNERTLFTFLSADGAMTLNAFLKTYRDDFQLITPDKIYDYFEPIFHQELFEGEIHKIFLLASRILIQIESSSLAEKIVKTLALIYMLEQFELISPTKSQLLEIFSFEHSKEEIFQTLDDLTEKNFVIYLRRSNGYLKLKQNAGIDVPQKIRDTMENLSVKFSILNVLNSENIDSVLYPSRYNVEREMIRWFDFRFVSSAEILSGTKFEFDGDGIVVGILPNSDSEIEELKNFLLSFSKENFRCIFVLPKNFVDMREIVLKFSAVKNLKEISEDDPILRDEYEIIFDDLQAVIKNFVESYTHPENFGANYIHDGKILRVYRKSILSEIMSKICDEIYSRTPIINNEVINKNEITNVAINSRSKIVSALLHQDIEKNLGLHGFGQDVSIMRSTLIRTGILINDDFARIDLRPENDDIRNLLETIENFIFETRQNKTSFSILYERLISPENRIGLRRGVIPIYLATVIHKYKQQLTISNQFGVIRLNSDVLTQINSAPENFSIEYLDWNSSNDLFISKLAQAFSDFVILAEKNSSDIDYVSNSMIRWFLSLPKYAKEFNLMPNGKKIPDSQIKFRNLLRQNLNGSDLLFKKLPQLFSEDFGETASKIIDSKRFFDEAIDNLKIFILNETKKIFHATDDLMILLRDWCKSLDPKIFEQLFSDETDKFLILIKSIDEEEIFIAKLAILTTGLRFEDWNEKSSKIYFDKLKQFKRSAENFRFEEISNQKIVFVDDEGEKIVRHFESVELSARGKLLYNQITSDIEAMGQSISLQEKRQILSEILRKL